MRYPAHFFRVFCTNSHRIRGLEDYFGQHMWYHIQPSNKILVSTLSLTQASSPFLPSPGLNASIDVFCSATSVEVSATNLCAKHALQDLALRELNNIEHIGQEGAEAYALPLVLDPLKSNVHKQCC